MTNYNTQDNGRQQEFIGERLHDGGTRREQPWREKRMEKTPRTEIYKNFNDPLLQRKGERMENCANVLVFRQHDSGEKKLHHADFCRVRLCPMCMWRRSLKIFGQVSKIMAEVAKTGKKYRPIFLTLTVKNLTAGELSDGITHLLKSFKRLTLYKRFEKAVKGWFRALEITYNADTNTYHPHVHVVLLVNPSYFKDGYISQSDWVLLWQKALQSDYLPSVDIRRAKNDGAIAQIAHYSVKDGNHLNKPHIIATLDAALANRRLIGYGGIMRDAYQRLQLEDPETSDLIHVGEDAISPDMNYILVTYKWVVGVNDYILTPKD